MKRAFSVIAVLVFAVALLGAGSRPDVKDVDLDELLKKWKQSDNWVLVVHTTTDGMYDKGDYCVVNEVEVIERNGNVTKKTHSIASSQDGHTTEYQTIYLNEYDGKNVTQYNYRKQAGEKQWDTSFVTPNPYTGEAHKMHTLEKFFDNWITPTIWYNIENNARTMREVGGVYHFWGIEDLNETWKWLATQLGNEYKPMYAPPLYQTFTYTLTFGNAKTQKPLNPS